MAKRNFIKRIVSSPIVQTFLIYLSGGWIALEMTDYFIRKYSLNERISDVLAIILLIGLPVAIFLAWYLSREKEEEREEVIPGSAVQKKSGGLVYYLKKKPWFSVPVAVVIILLMLTVIRYMHRQVKIKWAREEAIPQMKIMLEDWDRVGAFQLCLQAKKYIPDDQEFRYLDSEITRKFTVITEPAGAEVYYKEYLDLEGAWTFLGTTPIDSIDMPNYTLYRWKLEKPGYEVIYAVLPTSSDTLSRTMYETGQIPDGMVYVEGINEQTTRDYQAKDKNGFFIDKYEVTNKQYKDFIDKGGYQDSAFWQIEFILNNEILSFKEAMEQFIDATGRPGLANWEAGDFPDGEENYPVNGISWYEAAAFAEYAGKSLPTMDHWRSAAGLMIGPFRFFYGSNLIPLSNMKGIGTDPVGSNPAISCYGTYDMSGNVREWCWNETPGGKIIQGGAWDDANYMSSILSRLPPFDRSLKNGFRCAIYPEREKLPEQVFQAVEIKIQRDYMNEIPVSEVEFEILIKQFLYDKKDLNGIIEYRDETPADWILEKISFDAAYDKERMIAYLFLPKQVIPPFQAIIYFPGSGALSFDRILTHHNMSRNLNYIIKNGRAVIFPIYKGIDERKDGACNPTPPYQSHQYTDCLVKWIKDFSRSIDYLESRGDIDTARLCYLGDSWGGWMGGIIPAVEDRIKICVLLRGGLLKTRRFPETDPINYVTRVKTPVLMLNGKYDLIFPYETTVKPMYDLLGTPEQEKKLVLYETDHFIPMAGMVKEVLDWLDRYFGPVQKTSHEK